MNEVWKTIPRYPNCEVSNKGRVRYKDEYFLHCHGLTHQIRPIYLGGFGYYQVDLDGKTESIHNLVAETFIGPRSEKGYEVDHIDGNKLNNSPENLRWLVHGHNTFRSLHVGERRFFYEGELWLIKKLVAVRVPYKIIGRMFRCSTKLIVDVKKGLKDHHLKDGNGVPIWDY